MANLQMGLILMVVGMGLVFLILILLMHMMKAMSVLIQRNVPVILPESAVVTDQKSDEADVAALIAIVSQLEKSGSNPAQLEQTNPNLFRNTATNKMKVVKVSSVAHWTR